MKGYGLRVCWRLIQWLQTVKSLKWRKHERTSWNNSINVQKFKTRKSASMSKEKSCLINSASCIKEQTSNPKGMSGKFTNPGKVTVEKNSDITWSFFDN